MSSGDLIAASVSFFLTILVLSYIWQDTPLFRLAIHLFVGVAAGYTGAVAISNVIFPQLITPILQVFGGNLLEVLVLAFPPLILGLLLFAKLSTRFTWLGNPTMAFLVGVGAAAAIGGSILGTLFPQIQASMDINSLRAVIILIGTLTTLIYFQFSTRSKQDETPRRNLVIEVIGWGGQAFIAITFGVIFAGIFSAALTALIERVTFLLNFVTSLL